MTLNYFVGELHLVVSRESYQVSLAEVDLDPEAPVVLLRGIILY
jgi:hypothetical protein